MSRCLKGLSPNLVGGFHAHFAASPPQAAFNSCGVSVFGMSLASDAWPAFTKLSPHSLSDRAFTTDIRCIVSGRARKIELRHRALSKISTALAHDMSVVRLSRLLVSRVYGIACDSYVLGNVLRDGVSQIFIPFSRLPPPPHHFQHHQLHQPSFHFSHPSSLPGLCC